MNNQNSLFERFSLLLAALARRFSLPIISTLAFGFLAHTFAFTNKLINADEASALFSKGATLTSGRWGLELTKLIFPDVSMPWIYGVIGLVLIAACVCVTIVCFEVKKPLSQLLLSGVFASFPALTGNYCYMFTSASYALAVFFAIFAVYLFKRGGRARAALGCVMLAFSLGVYQAYIALAASFCVVLCAATLMNSDTSAQSVLRAAVRYLLLLCAALALYYAVTFIVELTADTGYQEYEVTSKLSIFRGFITAYTAYVGIFVSGNYGFITSPVSLVAHIVCLALIAVSAVLSMLRRKDARCVALLVVLFLLYPLSVNCMYLIVSPDIIHTLVLFSFVSFYVLVVAALETLGETKRVLRALGAVALALIIMANVYFANKVYLKMYLEYENAYTFYNALMAEVMDNPHFSRYTVIDIVGDAQSGVTDFSEKIDTSNFTGSNEDLVNIYTRVSFIKNYIGLDLYMYREDTILRCDWYDEMPCYPDDGCIKWLEDENRLVVKLS